MLVIIVWWLIKTRRLSPSTSLSSSWFLLLAYIAPVVLSSCRPFVLSSHCSHSPFAHLAHDYTFNNVLLGFDLLVQTVSDCSGGGLIETGSVLGGLSPRIATTGLEPQLDHFQHFYTKMNNDQVGASDIASNNRPC